MRKSAWGIFAIAYLITLLALAPASLLDKILEYSSKDRLALANASGTVWNGSAVPVLRTHGDAPVTLPLLHWNIAFFSLFTGNLHARIHCCGQPLDSPMEATLSLRRIELSHVQFKFPARLLSAASPMLTPLQFQGQFQIQSDHLTLSRQGMKGSAFIDWKQASSVLSPITPLGNYRMALHGATDKINLDLTTSSGILRLTGHGNWSMGHGLELHGQAEAVAKGQGGDLNDLLRQLGPEIAPGVHEFNLIQR